MEENEARSVPVASGTGTERWDGVDRSEKSHLFSSLAIAKEENN